MTDTTEVTTPNYLEMSDEDIMKAPPPSIETVQETTPDPETGEGEKGTSHSETVDPDAKDDEAAGAAKAAEESAKEGSGGETGDDPEKGEKEEKKPDAAKEEKTPEQLKAEEEAAKNEKKDPPEETKPVDYEAEYKRLLTPFKANGREIQVKSVDDAIQLMQMGANYNKKMAALKPNLKLMKMLQNNNLLSEEKLSFFIDLEKKDPAAINKLVKDAGINPMDLDAEKATSYKQSTHSVDDREIELDTILEEIQDSPSYNRTLDIVGKKWDVTSKQTIASTPQLLKVINDHVEKGIYDIISKEIESERLLGRLSGLSDIEAYRQVGDRINAQGGFNHLGSSQKKPEAAAPIVVTPKPQTPVDDKLKDKKRAASSTKPAAPTTTKPDFNPLALSDEEFSKLAAPKYT